MLWFDVVMGLLAPELRVVVREDEALQRAHLQVQALPHAAEHLPYEEFTRLAG